MASSTGTKPAERQRTCASRPSRTVCWWSSSRQKSCSLEKAQRSGIGDFWPARESPTAAPIVGILVMGILLARALAMGPRCSPAQAGAPLEQRLVATMGCRERGPFVPML